MGWKIKVLTPNDSINYWYVTSIKSGGTCFSGTTSIEDAKVYKNRNSFQKLLEHIDSRSGSYELIEITE